MNHPVTPLFYCTKCAASHPVKDAEMRARIHYGHQGVWGTSSALCVVVRS